MLQSFLFWFLALVVLSAAPGWYLSDINQKRKASIRAGIEMQQQEARISYDSKRRAVEDNRQSSQGLKVDHLALKSGKTLEHATVTNFNEEGLTFATPEGGAHVPWVDLPEDWVAKYRFPLPPVQVTLPTDLNDPDELANIERNRVDRERAQIAMQERRDEIARARADAVGKSFPEVKVKGRPLLQNVSVKVFHDDGITFTTQAGLLRMTWNDLPDDWVNKFRDPVAATQAAAVKAQQAAAVQTMEKIGRDVDVVFMTAVSNEGISTNPTGAIVKVISEMRQTRVDLYNQYLFVMNLASSTFKSQTIVRMRLYPTGRQLLTNPAALTDPNARSKYANLNLPEKIPVYSGDPALALQISRELGVKLIDLTPKYDGGF